MKDFKDCTFLIPYKNINNVDRYNNLLHILNYLNNHMNTNIVLMEQETISPKIQIINIDNYKNLKIIHKKSSFNAPCFHKTKLYNLGLKEINTDIVIPYDGDILLPIKQLIEAKKILNDGYDYCFPFSNNYIEIVKNPSHFRNKLLKDYDFNDYKKSIINFQNILIKRKVKFPGIIRNCPPGGCLFIKKNVYINFGMENEDFCGYGPEDAERKSRLIKLQYSTKSVYGDIFHLEHEVETKRITPLHYKKIYDTLEKMSKEQIIDYYNKKQYRIKYGV